MKKEIKYCLVMAAAAMAFTACSSEETVDNSGPVEARFTAGIGAPATRAVDNQWNADHIGIIVTNASNSSGMDEMYRNVEYYTNSTGTTANFSPVSGGIFFQDKTETVTFSAYAPYQGSSADNVLPGTDGDGVIDVDTKTYNGDTQGKKQEDIDFLFASGATASQSSPTVSFADNSANGGEDNSFHHKMAQLKIVFQVSTTDGFSATEIFTTTNTFNLGGLIHEGTFNVTNGTTALKTGSTAVDDWNITSCKHTDNEANSTRTYSLILLPQDVSGNPLKVAVGIAGQTYSNNEAIKPNLKAGYSYTYTITVKKTGLVVSGCTITDWVDGGDGEGNASM